MSLSFCSFASGSSGNSYLIKSKETAILVDAGISLRKILKGLEATGTEEAELKAVLLTHEHTDHCRSVGALQRKFKDLKAYGTMKTFMAMGRNMDYSRGVRIEKGQRFSIGDIGIISFGLNHDAADPLGYSFYKDGKQISIATDTGYVDEVLFEEIKGADLLVLEANHDVDMLKIGPYPWFLKQRILGDNGHLSNEAAGHTLARLISQGNKKRQILLAHLSRENNFPEMAYQTVKNILEEQEFYIGKHVEISTIMRDEISILYRV